jgi:tetratricopeptide (TPR) repeat protein
MKSILLIVGLLLAALACSPKQTDPQKTYNKIRGVFLRGDLAQARSEAKKAYDRFSPNDVNWGWRFRLLEADVMATEGENEDVLEILRPELPPSLSSSDLAVRRAMLRALALARLGNFPQSELYLSSAERMCSLIRCPSQGEIARIGGAVAVDKNELDRAEQYFRASLRLAQGTQDKFLEVSDLLNLGVVAMQEQHFDESITWSSDAEEVSKSIKSQLDEEKALGNLGWAYYKLGDFEKSLEFFKSAASRADELYVQIDKVEWLNNIGLVYYQLGQYSKADTYYEQSLDLARKQ